MDKSLISDLENIRDNFADGVLIDTLDECIDYIKELENINDKLSNALNSAENKVVKYKSILDKIKEKLKEDNKYLESAKEMYITCEDELLKSATIQLINNNQVRNDDILELLEEIE